MKGRRGPTLFQLRIQVVELVLAQAHAELRGPFAHIKRFGQVLRVLGQPRRLGAEFFFEGFVEALVRELPRGERLRRGPS